MNQSTMILVVALLVGLFAAGSVWLSFDLVRLLVVKLATRRERKRLEAEARALKAAEGAGDAID